MVPITDIGAAAYTIPTESPEADGTLSWSATTLVLVRIGAGGQTGLGYSYADRSAVTLIADRLAPRLRGQDATAIPALWETMVRAVRNLGASGIAAMAISAVDNALWDLKARLFGRPLLQLLGAARTQVPVYGSGGFTSYDVPTLQRQLQGWAAQGITRFKMKVGRDDDRERVAQARAAIGARTELFVDANGAYAPAQALAMADAFAASGVTWFEEPVPAWDHRGLAEVRRGAPHGMEISAGEYGWSPRQLKRLLDDRAVDVLQADATRCLGISGFLQAGALCGSAGVPLSSHCAPALHVHVACALPAVRHIEYFHDHVRIERQLFAGVPALTDGCLAPAPDAPGLGLEFKQSDAERFRV
jgi:L-alanine-DL-glutamate epimerase-like enolase superfamily enzyme